MTTRPAAVLSVVAALLALAITATAGTLTVTDCGDSGDPGQIRALISQAQSGDSIVIPACTIFLSGPAGEDANAGGDLDIGTPVTLQGAGMDLTVLDGNGIDRVVHVLGVTATIQDLTIRNGHVSDDSGGGLRNQGITTLVRVAVTGNSSDGVGSSGGGGVTNSGSLTILDSRIEGNAATGHGGGLLTDGVSQLLIEDTRVAANSALLAGGGVSVEGISSLVVRDSIVADNRAGGNGGGLNVTPACTLTVERTTISGNRTNSSGGGVAVADEATITNSAVVHNVAQLTGGGLYPNGFSPLTMVNSTVANNVTGGRGGGFFIFGFTDVVLINTTVARNAELGGDPGGAGGIVNFDSAFSTLELRNSVVADNSVAGATPASQADLNVPPVASIASFVGTSDGDARLGPLADNGGSTLTMVPRGDSPLVDSGADEVATAQGLATDQRGPGFPRFLDGNGNGIPGVDIGAVEFKPAEPPPPPPPPPNPLTISPPSGLYTLPQAFDLVLAIDTQGRAMVGGQALLDGADVTAPLVACVVPGTAAGRLTFQCGPLTGGLLGPGTHTLEVTVNLDDGTSATRTVTWEVLGP